MKKLLFYSFLYLSLQLVTDIFAEEHQALLVGINQYDSIGSLKYCDNDVQAAKSRLADIGFKKIVYLTTDTDIPENQPTLKNIQREMERIVAETSEGGKLLIMLSGHGFSKDKESFFCPKDVNAGNLKETAINIKAFLQQLEQSKAAQKILIIDACRNVPQQAKGIEIVSVENLLSNLKNVSGGVYAFISCSDKEQSWEDESFQHGIFTYFLLEGLKGKADEGVSKDGKVSFDELCKFVRFKTKEYAESKLHKKQTPEFRVSDGKIPDFDFTEVNEEKPKLEEYTNNIGIRFVKIPAGEFRIGTDEPSTVLKRAYEKYYEDAKEDWFKDEYPSKLKKVEKPFWLGQTEITRGQFERFVKETGYKTTAEQEGKNKGGFRLGEDGIIEKNLDASINWRTPGFPQDETHPVVNISWDDADKFCEWLSNKEEGKFYRLPTEIEWEYAAKAGTQTRYWFGDDAEALAEYDNVADDTGKIKYPNTWTKTAVKSRDNYIFTAPVDAIRVNPWGLFGVHGNVAEWCGEPYRAGDSRMNIRGGSWYYGPNIARSVQRGRALPIARRPELGFRIVLEID